MKKWIQATRPKTLFASIGPVLLGLALTKALNAEINPLIAVNTILCAITLQISSNFANDYYDAVSGLDNAERLGPQRVTQAGIVTTSQMKIALIFVFLLCFLFGLNLMIHGGLPIIIIGLMSILFAWAYTGGPLPLSRYGLGELFAFIFFGPVAVWGSFYLQTKHHSDLAIILGAGPGFLSSALMSINNLRDRKSDRRGGKMTLAVLFPLHLAKILPHFFLLLSLLIPLYFIYLGFTKFLIFTCIPQIIFINTWIKLFVEGPSVKFNDYLATMGKCLFLYCLIFATILVVLKK
ncbi:MAG: 1,4-dihydroxy-2-naphthoate octaprenyltransferase [Bacteriovoracaceae bacterium]|jgi:1,4-dihydroxy-2-naphthoate polyprenyltransferase|nr:1,4-dihydroxy-2-naphthoate octaprenyltransferase [Bacteriovoracaceae bacterium]